MEMQKIERPVIVSRKIKKRKIENKTDWW